MTAQDEAYVRHQRILREAAQSMRELHPISHPRHEMWDRMARLCESVAAGGAGGQVLEIAIAYLATVGRPDLDGSLHLEPMAGYHVIEEHVGGCNGKCVGDRHYLIRGTT